MIDNVTLGTILVSHENIVMYTNCMFDYWLLWEDTNYTIKEYMTQTVQLECISTILNKE